MARRAHFFFAASGSRKHRPLAFRTVEARRTFELAISFRNDVGLLAEEADAVNGGLLGNFPQAFSHVGLVNAAATIADVEARQRSLTK